MGRTAWGRRPPLTRERRNQPCRLAAQVDRWSQLVTAGRRAGRGIGGEAGPADGGRDGLGAGPPAIPAVGVGRGDRDHPAEKNAATGRSARRVSQLDRENGAFGLNPARSGQQPDIEVGRGLITLSSKCVRQLFACGLAAALPSASTLRDVHPLHQGRRAGGGGGEPEGPSAAVPQTHRATSAVTPRAPRALGFAPVRRPARPWRPAPTAARPSGGPGTRQGLRPRSAAPRCGKPASRKPSGLHPPRDRRRPDARSLSRLRRVHEHHLPPCLAHTHSVAGWRALHQRSCSQRPAAWPKGFWAAFPAEPLGRRGRKNVGSGQPSTSGTRIAYSPEIAVWYTTAANGGVS